MRFVVRDAEDFESCHPHLFELLFLVGGEVAWPAGQHVWRHVVLFFGGLYV